MEAAGGAGVGAGLPTAAHWLVPGPRTPLARGAALAGSRREAREREPAARPPACRGVQGGWVPIRSWTLPSRLPPSPALRLRIHRRNQDSSKWEPWEGAGSQRTPSAVPAAPSPRLGTHGGQPTRPVPRTLGSPSWDTPLPVPQLWKDRHPSPPVWHPRSLSLWFSTPPPSPRPSPFLTSPRGLYS